MLKLLTLVLAPAFQMIKRSKYSAVHLHIWAPEIVAKKEFCGPPADIWASGVLLFAFFCGCFPLEDRMIRTFIRKYKKEI